MRISIVNRALIKTLFEMDTIKIIGGTFKASDVWRSWHVIASEDVFLGKKEYHAYITGPDEQTQMMEGEILDEVLDALESTMEELAAA